MKQGARAFDMLEKAYAEASARRGARNEAGDVGDDEARANVLTAADRRGRPAVGADPDDAEVRHQRGERIVGDLRPSARDRADEGALAHVREAEQAHVGHHFQLEAELHLLPRLARLGPARRAVERRREVDVPPTAATAAGDDDLLLDGVDIEEQRARLGVESLRADGDLHDEVGATLAVLVFTASGLAALGGQAARQLHVEQRRLAGIAHEDDIAALAAIAARGAAVRDVLLAAERDAPVAPVAGEHLHLARIDELHADCLRTITGVASCEGVYHTRSRP